RRRQLVTVRRSPQAVRVVRAACLLDIEQLTRYSVDRNRRVLHLTNQAALAAAVAKCFPLFVVQLAQGVVLPKTASHRLPCQLYIAAEAREEDRSEAAARPAAAVGSHALRGDARVLRVPRA